MAKIANTDWRDPSVAGPRKVPEGHNTSWQDDEFYMSEHTAAHYEYMFVEGLDNGPKAKRRLVREMAEAGTAASTSASSSAASRGDDAAAAAVESAAVSSSSSAAAGSSSSSSTAAENKELPKATMDLDEDKGSTPATADHQKQIDRLHSLERQHELTLQEFYKIAWLSRQTHDAHNTFALLRLATLVYRPMREIVDHLG